MSNKTAVEFLFDAVYRDISYPELLGLITQARIIEKKQHRKKWQEGWNDAFELVENSRNEGLNIGQHE
jgi:hypothetical protein